MNDMFKVRLLYIVIGLFEPDLSFSSIFVNKKTNTVAREHCITSASR